MRSPEVVTVTVLRTMLWFLILKSRYVALDSVDNSNDCKKWLVDLTIVSVWYPSVCCYNLNTFEKTSFITQSEAAIYTAKENRKIGSINDQPVDSRQSESKSVIQ